MGQAHRKNLPPNGWRFTQDGGDFNYCCCEERGACNPALLTGGSRSILRRRGDLADPRCVPLEAMDGGKTLADFLADRPEGPVETGVQLVAPSLILTVEDLIHHGEFLSSSFVFQSAIGRCALSFAAGRRACSTSSNRCSASRPAQAR